MIARVGFAIPYRDEIALLPAGRAPRAGTEGS